MIGLRWLALLLAAFVATPTLAQTYVFSTSGGGVISYAIGNDGKLDGRFTLYGGGGVIEREVAVPRHRSGLGGVYDTRGTAYGAPYGAVLTIRRLGQSDDDLYALSWDNGDQGIGLRRGSRLLVGYGRGNDMVGLITADAAGGWTLGAVRWRDDKAERFDYRWEAAAFAGYHRLRSAGDPPSETLRVEADGSAFRLLFGDIGYGMAMPLS